MTVWTIIPRDPLIFRDGRPFTADAGASATSLPFPYPSTIVGAMRTHAGPDEKGEFSETRIKELLAMELRGPLLVELDKNNEITEWLLPAPADALLTKTGVGDTKIVTRYRLRVLQTPKNIETNLDKLKLVGTTKIIKDKPYRKAPRYWKWTDYKNWLLGSIEPASKEAEPIEGEITPQKIGYPGLITENRIHVSIDPKTGTGIPGALFQTSGLEFTHLIKDEGELYPNLQNAKKLALTIESSATLKENFSFVGGERRVAQWKTASNSLLKQPQCPVNISAKISNAKACRLILLTPAYFEKGNIPSWLLEQEGIEIIAAATPRYQVVSGWNREEKKNCPKPTRRLTPAGSVYFIKFDDKESAENFVKKNWLESISDDPQSRLDGFGLAILGTWDGNLAEMEAQR